MGKRPTVAQPIHEPKLGDRIYEVVPDVYRLTMPTDFSVGNVNIYFVDGPDPVLIDTGVAGSRTIECLDAALNVIGRTIKDIATLLITHTHVDHAGSTGTIHEIAQCDVLVHARAHRYLSDIDEWWVESLPWYQNFFLESGFHPEKVQRFGAARKIMGGYSESCGTLKAVKEGDRLSLAGGRIFTVNEMFGHTTDHVVYSLEDAGVVFTADHLLPRISANPTLEPPHPFDDQKARPLILYRDSLMRTAELSAEIACPGHGRSFQNIPARSQEIAAQQAERCEKILDLIASNPGVNRKSLSLEVFGSVGPTEIYLTLSEISAAVELLETDGKIQSELEKDVERYSTL